MIRIATLAVCLASSAAAQPACLCLKCLTGSYDLFVAPAGSMKPTIRPGQCFTTRTEVVPADLTPGTIITFRHPVTGEIWFKRIVATAGQTVQMSSGRLYVDGNPVTVEQAANFIEPFAPEGPGARLPRCANAPVADGEDCVKTQWIESLGRESYSILDIGKYRFDDTPLFEVPAGHLFVLGDNRDNSVDSRVPQSAGGVGFVPVENVTGILDEVRP